MSIVILVLVLIPIIAGYLTCDEMTIGIEINRLNSPFYNIGVASKRYYLPEDQEEDELIIGLFLINIVLIFWRDNSEERF